jgi:hypothetical protein
MELIFIKQDTSEWDFIWLWLELHPINEGIEEPKTALNNGKTWEYMGTYRNNGKIVHEFVHRNHPKTNKEYTASLNASDTFSDDQIEKIVQIK